MPRSVQEILDHAEKLATAFEDHEPVGALEDAAPLREVRQAFLARARAEQAVSSAVSVARAKGHSWAAIGAMLGTSGEAVRQRYGSIVSASCE